MYAKLISGANALNNQNVMRDIGRLLTSPNPSLANLYAFSNTLSVIVDATPAGWTYVGSNYANDVPSISTNLNDIANTTTSNSTNFVNYAFYAPALNGKNKYAVLTQGCVPTTSPNTAPNFWLTGATNAASNGFITNEGGRIGTTLAGTGGTGANIGIYANNIVIHLIANPRHITIVAEGNSMMGVWEATSTDMHTYYGKAPFIQYGQFSTNTITSAVSPGATIAAVTQSTFYNFAIAFDTYNANTSGYVGNYNLNTKNNVNLFTLYQVEPSLYRRNTISTSGIGKSVSGPVMFSMVELGYPLQMISGVTPIYWMNANTGISGDQVYINGATYTFINTGNAGIAIGTS